MKSTDRSLQFLLPISRRRPSAQKDVDSIAEYIEQRAARLTAEDLEELRDSLTHLNQQFASIVTPEFPYLQLQLKLLGTFFADCTDGIFQTAPTAHGRKLRSPSAMRTKRQTSSRIALRRSGTPMIRSSCARS